MMTNKALLCELTATLRQMDWNNTKTAWKTSHVKAKQLYQKYTSFLVKITLFGFHTTIYHKFDGLHFMQNQLKPKMLSTVKLCVLIVFSILDHSLKLHNSALKKGCYQLLNIYRKCINNVKIWSISNDKEIETAIFQADSMILSATFKSFKNIVSFIMHLKDTHIYDCHNKVWNNSDMFTSSIFWFSCCPKECV